MSRKLVIPRKMDILKALNTSPPVPDYVLPGLEVGIVGALIAPGGVGKTTLLLQTAVALAAGLPVFGGLFSAAVGTQAPAKVVLIVAEETVNVMHRRLHAVIAGLLRQSHQLMQQEARDRLYASLDANLDLYPLAGATRLLIDGRDTTGDGLETLRAMSVGARLLVVDPLRQFHTGDENDSFAMTALVQDLQTIATGQQCAVLMAHHTTKSSTLNGQGDLAGASRGSGALTAGIRMQLNLSTPDDAFGAPYGLDRDDFPSYVRIDISKANYLPPQPPQLMRRGAGGVFDFIGKPADSSPAKKRRKA